MSDISPSSEKTTVIDNARFCRLRTLTYVSIALNVLILLIFVACAVGRHHHQRKHHPFGGRFGGGCPYANMMPQRSFGGQGFHHGGMGWGGGGGNPMMDRNPNMPGGNPPGMMNGGFGEMGGGFNRPDMRRMGPPDPAKISDMLLNRLSGQLTLTDDEKAKIKPLLLDQATQMQKDLEAQRTIRDKAIADTKAKIRAVLTPDQQKQLDALPLPGERPAPTPPPAPAK